MSRKFIREEYLKLEIIFLPVLPSREIAIAWLSELDFEVFESTDTGLIAHTPLKTLIRLDLDHVKSRLEKVSDSMEWYESLVQTENWNAEWEENYEPVLIDDLAQIRAPFHPELQDGLDVIIKPDMSFGTGHHETTWMMVKTLLMLEVKGSRVLDMGCGTGVLAIASILLGAVDVLAIDIEKGAVRNTTDNAKLNDIQTINVHCGTSDLLKGSHDELNDIILANINRNVLLADMKIYNSVLKPGGRLVFSGFFMSDVNQMTASITALGLQVVNVIERDGWACILCGKPVE
jgi:ribosomal protein L11 methyltransferase|tara:strand:- start:86 stop:955 length:870 start_codon:yes stop_codon:yes gene_type:complete